MKKIEEGPGGLSILVLLAMASGEVIKPEDAGCDIFNGAGNVCLTILPAEEGKIIVTAFGHSKAHLCCSANRAVRSMGLKEVDASLEILSPIMDRMVLLANGFVRAGG